MRGFCRIFSVLLLCCAVIIPGLFIYSKFVIKKTTEYFFGQLQNKDSFTTNTTKDVVNYGKIEVSIFPAARALVKDIKVDIGGADFHVKSVLFSYNLFGKTVSITLPDQSVFVDIEHGGEGGVKTIACSMHSYVNVEWDQNILLYALKRVFAKDKVTPNFLVRASYSDDNGISCKDEVSGKDVMVYSKGNLDVLSSDNRVKVNADFVAGESNELLGPLSFKIMDAIVHRYEDGRTDFEVFSFRLWRGESFSISLSGNTSVTPDCASTSFRRCPTDLVLEIAGYGNLLRFVEESFSEISGTSTGEDVESPSQNAQIVDLIAEATKRAATSYDDDGDILTLSLQSDGKELYVGRMPFNEFFSMIADAVSSDDVSHVVDE